VLQTTTTGSWEGLDDGIDPVELEKYLSHFKDYNSALKQIQQRVPKAYFTNSTSLTLGEQAESTAFIASTLGLYYVLELNKMNETLLPQQFTDEFKEMKTFLKNVNVS